MISKGLEQVKEGVEVKKLGQDLELQFSIWVFLSILPLLVRPTSGETPTSPELILRNSRSR